MIREFEFILNYDNENINEKRDKQSYDDAQQFGLEFFYLYRYIQRKLKENDTIKAMKNKIPKEKHILYLYFGINYEEENFRYDTKERVLFYQGLFDYTKLTAVRNTNQRADILLDELAKNIHKCEPYFNGITYIMHNIIAEFRQDNYKNIWEFTKKRIKGVGTAKLVCELNPLRFHLRLLVEDKNKEIIFNQLIMTTLPDSICYHHYFKSLLVNDDEVIVPKRHSAPPLCRISIDDIIKGNTIDEPIRKENIPRWLIEFGNTLECPTN